MKKISYILYSFLSIMVISCHSEQRDFSEAIKTNTIESLKEFSLNHPNGEFLDSAKSIIDDLIWDTVLKRDNVNVYEIFILEHPNSKHHKMAKEKVDRLIWNDVIVSNTISDYEAFIEDYPESSFIDSAKLKMEILGKMPK